LHKEGEMDKLVEEKLKYLKKTIDGIEKEREDTMFR